MPNTPAGTAAQPTGPDAAQSTLGFSFANLSILLIQSSTIFVAFSILLGRIYFLKYYRTLGIPTSEVRLNILDYSVISPDVTILGVGIATLWAVHTWATRRHRSSGNRRENILYGIVLVGVGIALPFLGNLFGDGPEPGLGISAIERGLSLVISMYGGTFIGAAIAVGPRDDKDRALARQVAPLFYSLITIVFLLLILGNTSRYAESDAERLLSEAPQAKVQFTSSSPHNSQVGGTDVEEDGLSFPNFKVVLIGDRFIYFHPTDLKRAQGDPMLYAIPMADIVSITYLQE